MTDKTAIFADGFASKVSKSSSLGKVCILEHVTKYGNFLSGSVIKTRGGNLSRRGQAQSVEGWEYL